MASAPGSTSSPSFLFRLHEVDEKELIAGAGKALPLSRKAPAAEKVIAGEDLSALFGLDIAQGIGPDTGEDCEAKECEGQENPETNWIEKEMMPSFILDCTSLVRLIL